MNARTAPRGAARGDFRLARRSFAIRRL